MDGSVPAPIHDGVPDVDGRGPACVHGRTHASAVHGHTPLVAVSVEAANLPIVSEDAPTAQPLAITIDPPLLPPVPHPHSLPPLLPVIHPPALIDMPPK
jgi:hypothetical protein